MPDEEKGRPTDGPEEEKDDEISAAPEESSEDAEPGDGDQESDAPKPKRKSLLKRIATAGGLFLVVAVVLGLAVFEYSASPGFCNSCHIMNPYYAAWQTSSHKDVACVECHYPPGTRDTLIHKFQNISQLAKYVTGTYGSKPYAEIEDGSCLRSECHSTRLLEGNVEYKRGITFDHGPHLTQDRRGRTLRCTSCHSQIVVGNHMEVTETTCFLCHFKGQTGERGEIHPLGGCTTCHSYPDWDIDVAGTTFNHTDYVETRSVDCQNCHHDIAQGDGHAAEDRCLDCHNEPDHLERYEDTEFLHEMHVTEHDVDCGRCHTEIIHKLLPSQKPVEPACNECHENKHQLSRNLFVGRGGVDTPETPGHMFLARVNCNGCHATPQLGAHSSSLKGQTYVASDAACQRCHGQDYDGMLEEWNQTFNKMVAELQPRAAALKQALKASSLPEERKQALAEDLEGAVHNIDMVRVGHGVHNPLYAAELLQVANRHLDGVAEEVGEDPTPLPTGSLITGDYCAVLCHSRAKVEWPDTVQLNNFELAHADHHDDYQMVCTNCHSPNEHSTLRESFVGCSDCHHGEEAPDCQTCHSLQSNFYQGKLLGEEWSPNFNLDTQECGDCHEDGAAVDPDVMAETCVECHEETYRDMPAAWMEEGQKQLNEAHEELQQARQAVETSIVPEERRDLMEQELRKIGEQLQTVSRAKVIHNPESSREIFKKILEQLKEIKGRAAQSGVGKPMNGKGNPDGAPHLPHEKTQGH